MDGLAVTYRVAGGRRKLRRSLLRIDDPRQRIRTIEALKDVTFDVPHGSVLGVIGQNGAGKSTLLRAIAGILVPTRGRVEVHGQITTMLSLGVGFNRNLTGQQNVILGGLALGLNRKAVEAAYADIVNFAELGEFIDYPVSTYSSGMKSRLGFAVSTHLNPDILLIDEGLATGDSAFKEKCVDKMRELYEAAGTILLVSHGLNTIRELATHCLWLHKGRVKGLGEPSEVVDDYQKFSKLRRSAAAMEDV